MDTKVLVTDYYGRIARNTNDCPLFRLPLELRNKIWRLVLGDRLIHIDYKNQSMNSVDQKETIRDGWRFCSPWRHAVSQGDGLEDQLERKLARCDTENDLDAIRIGSHNRCDNNLPFHPDFLVESNDHETMQLTVLRACRSIYVETNEILFNSNTFSFIHTTAFKRFMMTRTAHQKRLIHSLRLDIHWRRCYQWNGPWSTALNMARIRTLPNLRTLRLHIKTLPPYDDIHGTLDIDSVQRQTSYWWDDMLAEFGEGLRRLSTLPLTDVQVIFRIGDHESTWPEELTRDVAGYWRSMLINPKGAEIYAEEARIRRENLRNKREAKEAAAAKALEEQIRREELREKRKAKAASRAIEKESLAKKDAEQDKGQGEAQAKQPIWMVIFDDEQ